MGKVKYKEPSQNFRNLYSVEKNSKSRFSIGKEKEVGEYYFLSINNLIPYEKQSRRIFSEQEINELAQTIVEHGIQSPLLIIPSISEVDKFEIVSGERRFRAAKLVGLEKVPCIIIDREKAEEIALVENIQRADLHPIEIGDSLQSLLSKRNWGDISKLAEKIGKAQSTISNYLAYARLPNEIKQYLVENNISARDILRKILRCSDIKDMEVLLGIKGNQAVSKAKSLLRISLDLDQIYVQDRNLFKISPEQRKCVILRLREILEKIEKY